MESRNVQGASNPINNSLSEISTVDGTRPPSSISMHSGYTNFSTATNNLEGKRYDVLKTYEKASIGGDHKSLEHSIFYGGIDTGIDIGDLYTPSLEHELMVA